MLLPPTTELVTAYAWQDFSLRTTSVYTQKVIVGVLKPPGADLHAPDAALLRLIACLVT